MRIPKALALVGIPCLNTACTTSLFGKHVEAWEDVKAGQVVWTDKRLVAALVLLIPGGVLLWIVWNLSWVLYRWYSGELKGGV